jgi:hypothetical protein
MAGTTRPCASPPLRFGVEYSQKPLRKIVIPAKAGIQLPTVTIFIRLRWIPAFAGMTEVLVRVELSL